MSHIEYQLATGRRSELLREAADRRRAGQASAFARGIAPSRRVIGDALGRLFRVAAVRTAPDETDLCLGEAAPAFALKLAPVCVRGRPISR